jgi:hypothetical protein
MFLSCVVVVAARIVIVFVYDMVDRMVLVAEGVSPHVCELCVCTYIGEECDAGGLRSAVDALRKGRPPGWSH